MINTAVKILCSLVIVAASGMIGMGFANKAVEKERLFEKLKNFLGFLENETLFGNNTIAGALKRCTRTENMPADMCRILADELENRDNVSFNDCWTCTAVRWLNDHAGEYLLRDTDAETIRFLMIDVFEGGESERNKHFELAKKKLEECRSAAAEEKNKNRKLYGKLGFLIGAAIVVFIF